MALIRYNNPNLLKFQNKLILNKKNILETAEDALATSGALETSGVSNTSGTNEVSAPSGTNNISEEEKQQILEEVKNALKENSEKWGIKNWNLTDEQIENLYNKLISDSSIQSFSGTKENFEKLVKTKLVVLYGEILSNNIWQDFDIQDFEFVSVVETLETFENKINSDEFNKDVSKEEATEQINNYAEFIKADLKEKYNYSDSYINNIIDVVIDNIFKQQSGITTGRMGFTNPFGQNQDSEKYNLQSILKQFKSDIENIIKEPNLVFNTRFGNLFDGNITPFSTQMLEAFSKSSNMQLQLLSKLFTSVIQEKGFNDEEAGAFINLVFKDCGANTNNSMGILSLTMEDLTKLDKNGDGSWFDELSNKINNLSKLYSHMEQDTIDNAQTIDAEQFIRDFATHGMTDYTMVDKIVMQLDNMALSNDPAMRKLAQMLNKAFEKYDCQLLDEKKDLVKWFLNLASKKCGNEDTRYYLTKDDINALNNKNIFEEFEKILESQELYYAYMVNSDGELGDFNQGSTGDCWLIAALIELKNSPYGKDIIRESIKHNDDGSVIVTFNGLNVSYTLSPEEIIEADQGPAYSKGDNDVLILEIATEKLRRDIASGKVKVPSGYNYTTPKGENDWSHDEAYRNDDGTPGTGIWGGYQSQMLYFLTGQKSNDIVSSSSSIETIKNECISLMNDLKNGKVLLGFSCDLIYIASHLYTQDEIMSLGGDKLKGSHAFAITNITDTGVTIVNPWDSSRTFTCTWEELSKFHITIHATRIA